MYKRQRLAIVKAGACDPNVLGIISDFVLEVDAIDICMVFSAVSYTHLDVYKRQVAQLVRAPPCHGGGHGFESRLGRL